MLLTRKEVNEIGGEGSHFSRLYNSKTTDYDYFLFHRKFKINLSDTYTIVSTNEYKDPVYVLRFSGKELKELFDKKKKKDGEKSDFIRIRFKGNTASFEIGEGNIEDITKYLVCE